MHKTSLAADMVALQNLCLLLVNLVQCFICCLGLAKIRISGSSVLVCKSLQKSLLLLIFKIAVFLLIIVVLKNFYLYLPVLMTCWPNNHSCYTFLRFQILECTCKEDCGANDLPSAAKGVWKVFQNLFQKRGPYLVVVMWSQ